MKPNSFTFPNLVLQVLPGSDVDGSRVGVLSMASPGASTETPPRRPFGRELVFLVHQLRPVVQRVRAVLLLVFILPAQGRLGSGQQ